MKKFLVMTLIFALMMSLVACQGADSTSGSEKEGEEGETKGEKLKIAYIVKAMSDQFWVDMKDGADAAAEKNDVELSFQAPENETDVEVQIQYCENAIASKVDAIILSAADSKALIPTIIKANKADIPVILVNDTIDMEALEAEGGFVETYCGIDQYEAAALAGKYAVENIDGGKVALLEGISGVDALEQRLLGFKDQVEAADGFEIVASQTANNDRNEGFNVMQNILTSNPDVSIVWAVNAEMGQGAVQAVEQAGLSGKVSVFDFDASNDDIETIQDGTLVGSVAQYPELQAEAAIKAAIDVINGAKLEEHTVTKAEFISAENVKEYVNK